MTLEESTRQCAEQLLNRLRRSDPFAPACFSVLGRLSHDPDRLCLHFTFFVQRLLSDTTIEWKSVALARVHSEVCISPLFLDGFLLAIRQWTTSSRTFTPLHSYVNKDFPQFDWSALKNSRLLSNPGMAEGFPDRIADHCIAEVLFANCDVSAVAESWIVDVNLSKLVALLTKRARDRFADALLIRHDGHPLVLFAKLEVSDPVLVAAILRRRDDLDLVYRAFLRPDDNGEREVFVQDSIKMFRRLQPESYLTFFCCLVLPLAGDYPGEFLDKFFDLPNFPSDDPLFPAQEFIESDCMRHLTFRVFFDVFGRQPDPTLMLRLFQACTEAEDPIRVFRALFQVPPASRGAFKELFYSFIEWVTPESFRAAISRYFVSNTETICEFCIGAVKEGRSPDAIVNRTILGLFHENAFLRPGPSLEFLLEVVVAYPESHEVREFWKDPTTIPLMLDAILSFHPQSGALIKFITRLSDRAPQWLLDELGPQLDGVPCVQTFRQNYHRRVDARF
jgi:hypothetical protein